MNVLLVAALPQDEPLLRTALEAGGAAVTHAVDGASALAAIERGDVDAIVLALEGETDEAVGLARAIRVRVAEAPVMGFVAQDADPVKASRLLDAGLDDVCGDTEALLLRLPALLARDPHVRRLERELAQTTRALHETRSRLDEMTRHSMDALRGATVLGLVRGVCHEINNPLTGILGYAQLLQETVDGGALDDIKEIETCAQRCRDLVGRLARFCVLDRAEAAPLDLNPLVEDALGMVEYAVKRGRLRTEIALAADLPQVRGHAPELRQAVLALLVQGVQAMSTQKGGTLTVRTHCSDGCVHLEVSDSGAGVAPEHLERLFDPFATPLEGGAADRGLRLAAARVIVAAHDGRITVSSPPSTGVTLDVALPVGDPPCTQIPETLSAVPV